MSFYVFVVSLFFNFIYCSEIVSRLPVRLFPYLGSDRFIKIQIEGKNYTTLVDTGSAMTIMRKDSLDNIVNKTQVSESECICLTGKRYLTPNFLVSELKIGDFFTEAVLKMEDKKIFTEGVVLRKYWFTWLLYWKTYLMYQICKEALIGIDQFQKFGCFFDFPHAQILLASRLSHILDSVFSNEEFYQLPFERGVSGGVVVKVETEFGLKNFLLDSGTNYSMIKLNQEEQELNGWKGKYKMDNVRIHDFSIGAWTFRVVDLANEFEIDGILGTDFFNRNIIGWDFQNNTMYIQTPIMGGKERFTYWLKSMFGK